MDNRWLESPPEGSVDVGHQLFSTPRMLLKVKLPHSLCLTSMAAIMVLGRGPGVRDDSLQKIYTQVQVCGLATLAHPASASGQGLSVVSRAHTFKCAECADRCPSFVHAKLWHCQTLG